MKGDNRMNSYDYTNEWDDEEVRFLKMLVIGLDKLEEEAEYEDE